MSQNRRDEKWRGKQMSRKRGQRESRWRGEARPGRENQTEAEKWDKSRALETVKKKGWA